MIRFTTLSPRAHEVHVEGHVTRDEVKAALDQVDRLLTPDPTGDTKLDMLADVQGAVHIDLAAIAEEMKHLPAMLRMIRGLDRVALVADRQWLRTVGRIEAALIPGITYEVYDRSEAHHARAWILRRTDAAHAPA